MSSDRADLFVAFDLGAESGRAMLARLTDDVVQLEEVHRFANLPQQLPSGYHWNLLDLWSNLVEGLGKSAALAGTTNGKLRSIGVDTWGVDFALLGKSGQLLGLPFAYRDHRSQATMQKAFDTVGKRKLYDATGIQFMWFNTLFQLMAQYDAEPGVVDQADRLLFMPDLLHYFFSGEMANEATIASTSQMIDPHTGQWHSDLLKQVGLGDHMLRPTVPAGAKVGQLRKDLAERLGVDRIDVIAPGSHDTASAIAAAPVDDAHAANGQWAYLSSGTWSLMGMELDQPCLTDASFDASFTHERGVGGKIRFLKNIAGLWLVQQVRADYREQGHSYDYAELTRLASEAQPMRTLIDPGHKPFAIPGGMLEKITAFARSTNQPVPDDPGQFVRTCLESLALCYRQTRDELVNVLDRPIDVLHLVGGGGRNELLDQLTADALGCPVIVGPYEATAVGNALTQAIGTGLVEDLSHLRKIVRQSFDPLTFTPTDTARFDEHYERFVALQK